MLAHPQLNPVPRRALVISLAALAVPVAVVLWQPDWTSTGLGMLIWLTALIPAFLFAYYRGLVGVAIALSGGMAVITATQVSVVMFQIAEPNWMLLGVIVGVYLAISIGVASLAHVLRHDSQLAEQQAMFDQLTGLPNRRHLHLILEGAFAAAERGRDLTTVMFDLDGFKRVNDRFGHPAGDKTLKAFAAILAKNTRKEDLSSRFGGEEFVTVLRETDSDTGVLFAQRVLDDIREQSFVWGKQTVSAGVATYEPGMGSFELLISAADRALYAAKNGGRDMVCVAPRYDTSAPAEQQSMPALEGGGAAQLVAAGVAAPRIYIVDDDAAVRSVIKRVLAGARYDLWDTGDPFEAIKRYADASPADRPAVILTDVIMPAMTGMRMIDQMITITPDIKVVYMSGYVQSNITWPGTPGSAVAFVEKPIDAKKLLGAIQDMLQRDPTQLAAGAANVSGALPHQD